MVRYNEMYMPVARSDERTNERTDGRTPAWTSGRERDGLCPPPPPPPVGICARHHQSSHSSHYRMATNVCIEYGGKGPTYCTIGSGIEPRSYLLNGKTHHINQSIHNSVRCVAMDGPVVCRRFELILTPIFFSC